MAAGREAGIVRDFERRDVEAVARLFQKTFRGSKKMPATLPGYLEEAFFDHPWADPEIRSKVHEEAGGKVTGFMGVLPSRLELSGREIRAAFAGSLMVENGRENPLAGARLVRSFLAGPQDLSLTETANVTAVGMWQKAGHPLDPGYSMNWMKVLRPSSTGVQLMERRVAAARLLRPLGRIADRAIGLRRGPSFKRPASGKVVFKDVTPEVFGQALLALKDLYLLRPAWNRDTLGWFLRHAEQKRNLGYPEWRVGYASDGRPVAAYAYFAAVGQVGWVLQALAAPKQVDDLLDDLLSHAYDYGCAAVRGAAHPWLTPGLMLRQAVFQARSFYVAAARDKTRLEPIRAGEALISGIAGESWMRLIGDRFD
ncbi:hypothetical protein CYG48_00425 [Neorhizobium sp. SOG26]|uniref:hypothetical protein n=1 Tax=Neorhizobium sp. SOG26 TaxID=2060726 RepID=UPI000E586113|nr:hypothetical protein [Neorhizobium sp. SOG26]AXV14317.1 hypothetical protein CYG48_00425 [Neorhizobium sp. SOG26]